MEQGQTCPYKISLDGGFTTWAPVDMNDCIRLEPKRKGGDDGGPAKKQR